MNKNETHAQVEAMRRLTPPARHCIWLRSIWWFTYIYHLVHIRAL